MPQPQITFTLKSVEPREGGLFTVWERSGLTPTLYPLFVPDSALAGATTAPQVLQMLGNYLEEKAKAVDTAALVQSLIGQSVVV